MARKEKQITVYPESDARLIVGGNSPACNRAIECWAIVLRQSMPELDREEWNFLAEVLNGTFDGDLALGLYEHGASALALEVHDAQALNGTGDKWLGDPSEPGSGKAGTDRLEAKMSAMTWAEVQYVRTAANFFWQHAPDGAIDPSVDEWWTIAFRVRLLRKIEEAKAG